MIAHIDLFSLLCGAARAGAQPACSLGLVLVALLRAACAPTALHRGLRIDASLQGTAHCRSAGAELCVRVR
jgi:hypothetical protein